MSDASDKPVTDALRNMPKASVTRQSTKEEAQRVLEAEVAKLQALSQGLAEDKAALIAEYVRAKDEDGPEKLKKNMRARVPAALEALDQLLAHGSDGVRANLAKYILSAGLNPDKISSPEDPTTKELTKLLEELKAND